MTITKTEDLDAQLLILAVHAGALKHACAKALELLENPNADHFDADKVERLLRTVLADS
jgi:hypothetical protein